MDQFLVSNKTKNILINYAFLLGECGCICITTLKTKNSICFFQGCCGSSSYKVTKDREGNSILTGEGGYNATF